MTLDRDSTRWRRIAILVEVALRHTPRAWTLGILSLLVLLPTAFVARIAVREWRSELAPPHGGLLAPPAGIKGMTDVRIPVAGRPSLGAWYVPPEHGVVVIVTHGSGGDRSSMLPTVRMLSDAGIGVLAFDWPGHGTSAGDVHWGDTCREALSAVARWVNEQPGVDRAQLGVLGFSYGGYMTAQVAAMDTALHRIALVGTPSDASLQVYHAYARYSRIGGWIAIQTNLLLGVAEPDTLKAIDMVSRFTPRPLLVIAGARDVVVPTAMADSLFARAGNPKKLLMMPRSGHGDYVWADSVLYGAALREFFAPASYPSAIRIAKTR